MICIPVTWESRNKRKVTYLTCWWPAADRAIVRFTKMCRVLGNLKDLHTHHYSIHRSASCSPRRRIHHDHSGPFLICWVPVIANWCSVQSVLQFTHSVGGNFTVNTQKLFSLQGVTHVTATNSHIHSNAENVTMWLFTASRRSRAKDLTEKFAYPLNKVVRFLYPWTFQELDRRLGNILTLIRNCRSR